MPYRIAIGSCSHPRLEQPLWQLIRSREPAAFIWGGDSVYSDHFVGLNWTAVGIHRVHNDDGGNTSQNNSSYSWRFTFPPPSIHVDASPDMIRYWYDEQWAIDDYRHFVEGWESSDNVSPAQQLTRPVIFGVIDDHDYGQNNGDATYQYKKESNVAFVDFLFKGTEQVGDGRECGLVDVDDGEQDTCESQEKQSNHDELKRGRQKSIDPMYQRALAGKGVYGVQLFDFSRRTSDASSLRKDHVLWGGGYWVPDEDARIDPDTIYDTNINAPSYSTTHSVAIFALDVRTNKTPWPKKKQRHGTNDNISSSNSSASTTPTFDFLGQDQWDWFKSALNNSRAAANIIVSGLQIHPERFPNDGNVIEEWSKFPEARQLLYDTILNSRVKSPLLVSGDVHMAQILRKDCVNSSDVVHDRSIQTNRPVTRPLIEITTSGMTHSWGTCFSSQPKNHRLPLKPYSYFVSRTFMTICHIICPWLDIVVRPFDDVNQETDAKSTTEADHKSINEENGGSLGKQYYLGLNYAEFEFDFNDHPNENNEIVDGSVTVRIFGRQQNDPPKLELTYTFDELSGSVDLPGMTAKFPRDFLTVRGKNPSLYNSQMGDDWICVPHRGVASIYHEYAANVGMFLSFCFLFFLPHGTVVYLLVITYRKFSRRKQCKDKSMLSTAPRAGLSNGRTIGKSLIKF
ncbi:hypothetical protein ACHAWU_007571 [Discostella pseudostelligera]|uniref:PhoD-like phosphatase metallophosphatase domain-containing protein n=1 Tax=Discostella pseudostelligera TaxID=259834 RepID=A0ABD3M8A3_9STRA